MVTWSQWPLIIVGSWLHWLQWSLGHNACLIISGSWLHWFQWLLGHNALCLSQVGGYTGNNDYLKTKRTLVKIVMWPQCGWVHWLQWLRDHIANY